MEQVILLKNEEDKIERGGASVGGREEEHLDDQPKLALPPP